MAGQSVGAVHEKLIGIEVLVEVTAVWSTLAGTSNMLPG